MLHFHICFLRKKGVNIKGIIRLERIIIHIFNDFYLENKNHFFLTFCAFIYLQWQSFQKLVIRNREANIHPFSDNARFLVTFYIEINMHQIYSETNNIIIRVYFIISPMIFLKSLRMVRKTNGDFNWSLCLPYSDSSPKIITRTEIQNKKLNFREKSFEKVDYYFL